MLVLNQSVWIQFYCIFQFSGKPGINSFLLPRKMLLTWLSLPFVTPPLLVPLLGSLMHSAQDCEKHRLIISKKTVLYVNYLPRFVNKVHALEEYRSNDSRHTKVYAYSTQTPGVPSPLLFPWLCSCSLGNILDPKWEKQWEYLKGTRRGSVLLSEHFNINNTAAFESILDTFWATAVLLPNIATTPRTSLQSEQAREQVAYFLLSSGCGIKMEDNTAGHDIP